MSGAPFFEGIDENKKAALAGAGGGAWPLAALAQDFPRPRPAEPVQMIFDTDLGNDCDDVLALAVIHALQNRRAVELLAVTLTNPDPLSGKLVDAINTFYGRPNIPIGVNPAAPMVHQVSNFLKVAENHPHDFVPEQALHAVALLRKTLAAAKDGEVVLV